MTCSHKNKRVVDSRFRHGYRFRCLECVDCGLRFISMEIFIASYEKRVRGPSSGVDYAREVERVNFINSLTDDQIAGIKLLMGG